MEDINNALLHIKARHNGEIPYQYGSRECARLMDSYAKEYHQAKLKLLVIADVVADFQVETKVKWKNVKGKIHKVLGGGFYEIRDNYDGHIWQGHKDSIEEID
jgi:hypothetical protein